IEWQRVVYTVRQKDYMPVQQDFFDHKNRLRKRMEFSDYEVKSGRLIPTKMRMMTIENNKVKSQTSMLILEASYNVTIPSSIFSKANLRR
ncbi:MAG: outer membrane lipoprotein-sorting protein, partial [Leptospiraceae bacterium]|nr:outer membrane lipoprotein-sorting protein [Leptospiraceae bacterium]